MSVTPEGKIKKLVRDTLHDFEFAASKEHREHAFLYQFWPVPNGMGASSLDCLVCYYGIFVAIEVKASAAKKPTPRQLLTISQIEAAGGVALVIGDQAGCDRLRETLEMIRFSHANDSKPKA